MISVPDQIGLGLAQAAQGLSPGVVGALGVAAESRRWGVFALAHATLVCGQVADQFAGIRALLAPLLALRTRAGG